MAADLDDEQLVADVRDRARAYGWPWPLDRYQWWLLANDVAVSRQMLGDPS